MNDTYAHDLYPQSTQPAEAVREEPRLTRRDDYVLRFDRSTPIVAAAAVAVGVLVGFALD